MPIYMARSLCKQNHVVTALAYAHPYMDPIAIEVLREFTKQTSADGVARCGVCRSTDVRWEQVLTQHTHIDAAVNEIRSTSQSQLSERMVHRQSARN